MAWIRWRETREGVALAALQWRDADGRLRSKALRTSDKRLARMHLDALHRELGESPRARPRDVNARRAIREFLEEKALSASPATVSQYRRRLEILLTEWDRVPLSDWNRRRYITLLASRTWSPRSIQLMTFICRNFIRWAQDSGIPVPDFVQGFRAPAIHQTEPPHLEADELRALLAAVQGRTVEPAVALCALAGLRLGEMTAATWDDVDWDEDTLVVHGTKTHADREVPLSRELGAILARHRAMTGPIYRGGHANLARTLKAACTRAAIKPVSWHPLRHTFATRLLAEGADLATVQELLGHRTPHMTMRYCHASAGRKREAVDRLGRSVAGS